MTTQENQAHYDALAAESAALRAEARKKEIEGQAQRRAALDEIPAARAALIAAAHTLAAALKAATPTLQPLADEANDWMDYYPVMPSAEGMAASKALDTAHHFLSWGRQIVREIDEAIAHVKDYRRPSTPAADVERLRGLIDRAQRNAARQIEAAAGLAAA